MLSLVCSSVVEWRLPVNALNPANGNRRLAVINNSLKDGGGFIFSDFSRIGNTLVFGNPTKSGSQAIVTGKLFRLCLRVVLQGFGISPSVKGLFALLKG